MSRWYYLIDGALWRIASCKRIGPVWSRCVQHAITSITVDTLMFVHGQCLHLLRVEAGTAWCFREDPKQMCYRLLSLTSRNRCIPGRSGAWGYPTNHASSLGERKASVSISSGRRLYYRLRLARRFLRFRNDPHGFYMSVYTSPRYAKEHRYCSILSVVSESDVYL